MNEEMWTSLLKKQGPFVSREVEIVPGCAVMVACPTCPDNSLELPGPGGIIRNMLGWSQLEKADRSGVWLFRGALQGESLFSSLVAAGDWVRKVVPHTVVGPFFVLRVLARMRTGEAPLSGQILESGASHC